MIEMTRLCLAELINIDVTDHIKTDRQIQNLKQAWFLNHIDQFWKN
jgi:hypothetical protein